MEKPKLIIEADNGEKEQGTIVRISQKANALIEDIAKKSGRSKSYIASKMIEFAFDYITIEGDADRAKEELYERN